MDYDKNQRKWRRIRKTDDDDEKYQRKYVNTFMGIYSAKLRCRYRSTYFQYILLQLTSASHGNHPNLSCKSKCWLLKWCSTPVICCCSFFFFPTCILSGMGVNMTFFIRKKNIPPYVGRPIFDSVTINLPKSTLHSFLLFVSRFWFWSSDRHMEK